MFEISALSWQHISISLEHPLEESMATAELDLSDISNVICKIHTPTSNGMATTTGSDPTSELASRVLQRCLSIPVTMRSVIKLWDEQVNRKNHMNGNENFSLPLRAVDPGGQNGNTGNPLTDFGGLDSKIKHEHGSSGNGHSLSGTSMAHPHQGMFLNESMMSGSGFPTFPGAEASLSMLNNMEISSLLSGNPSSSQSVEKPTKRSHKRKASEELWKNPKRKSGDDAEILMESSSSDSNSVSTPMSHDAGSEIATPNSVLGFHSDLELSGLDTAELMNTTEKTVAEYECSREADDLAEVEDILSVSASSRSEHKSRKSREERKSSTPSLMAELGEKQIVPPSVSITPIAPQSQGFNTPLTGIGLERRPGIEIIPIATTPAATLPSSITITPIAPSHSKSSSEERSREKKSAKNRSDEKSKIEKKRKKKRDEGPMGPPDKLPPKQDPLTKPVSVSIKPAESPPLPNITPTSPSGMLRKYSTSPTQGRNLSVSGKSSPSLLKPMKSSSSSSHHSPKHSPAHVMSSPKHATLPGISSPKNHGTSPKHPSAGSSGKPSMSTLKSAANSPSSKSSDSFKSKSTSKDSTNRDKEKKSSSVFSVNNPKVKSSSVKLKQLDLNTGIDVQSSGQSGDSLPSPSGTMDLSKSSALNQVRNRKGSLSAVIDKLKSAQHCGSESESSSGGGNGKSGSREGRSSSSSSKMTDNKTASKLGETKNSEYMVKPSSDGMKITINKTRTKESSKSSSVSKSQSSAGTGSPKTHTGLKPGVNSGPASKKPQQMSQKSSSNINSSSASYSSIKSSSKSPSISKSSSSSVGLSKSVSKLSGSPKTGSSNPSDLSRSSKDGRPRLSKGSSDKSIFSSKERRSSPTTSRDEIDSDRFKMLTQHNKLDQGYPSPLLVEGMISMKSLDTNFQIPKLSARTNDGDKKNTSNKINTTYSDTSINNINRTVDASKMYDMMSKNEISLQKYPLLSSNNKSFENNMDSKRNSLVGMSSTSPLLPTSLQQNPLSFTSSSSPKLNLSSQSHLKDTSDQSVNLSGPDLTTSIAETLDKSSKMKDASSTGKDDASSNCKIGYPISAAKNFSVNTSSEPGKIDNSVKFSSPQTKSEDKKQDHLKSSKGSTSSQEAAEMLLDFSTNSMNKSAISEHLNKLTDRVLPLMPSHRNTTSPLPLGPPVSYPASPSVSVHIVKSPAPSPLVNPSPHSASPCITDDELMDEALVGLGK